PGHNRLGRHPLAARRPGGQPRRRPHLPLRRLQLPRRLLRGGCLRDRQRRFGGLRVPDLLAGVQRMVDLRRSGILADDYAHGDRVRPGGGQGPGGAMADGPRGRGPVGDRPAYGQLFCGAATKKTVLVYKILGESNEWTLVGSMGVTKRPSANRDGEEVASYIEEADGQVVFKKRPWPLRFQGGVLEVLFWVAGRVVGVALAGKRVREAAAFPVPCDGSSDDVPHISTVA
ncbi:unnamed protein product, partial [Musa acuminata subsp. burmannicoides]